MKPPINLIYVPGLLALECMEYEQDKDSIKIDLLILPDEKYRCFKAGITVWTLIINNYMQRLREQFLYLYGGSAVSLWGSKVDDVSLGNYFKNNKRN